jgi:MFS family permease
MSRIQIERNITLLMIFGFFQMFMIIIPVIVPLFQSKGLDLAQIFYLQAIFAGIVVCFEIPSGYFADRFGRRRAVTWGGFMTGVGYTVLTFADDFSGLVLFECSVGIGLSLTSGADIALLYDSQKELDAEPEEQRNSIANFRMSKSMAETAAALVGGVVVLYSFNLLVLVQAFISWLPFVVTLFLVEPSYHRLDEGGHLENAKRVLSHIFVDDSFLRLLFITMIAYSLSTFYVVWLMQPWWEGQGIPLSYFGVLWAGLNLMVGVSAKVSVKMERHLGAGLTLTTMAALPAIGYFSMALMDGWVVILLSAGFYLSRGINQVVLTDAFNARIPSEFRATANSLTGFAFRLVFIVTGPMIGYLTSWQGLSTTLMVLGIATAALYGLLMLPLIKRIPSHSIQQTGRAAIGRATNGRATNGRGEGNP